MALKCQQSLKDSQVEYEKFKTRTRNEEERLQEKTVSVTKRLDDIQSGMEELQECNAKLRRGVGKQKLGITLMSKINKVASEEQS